jgi:hypothetical protein
MLQAVRYIDLYGYCNSHRSVMLRSTDRIYSLVDGFYVTLTVYFMVGESEFVTVICFRWNEVTRVVYMGFLMNVML